jgi:hypothetical protein
LAADDTVLVDGIRITTPVRTAFDAARTAPSLGDAVVALDMLARGHPDFLNELAAYTAQRRGWAGVPLVRRSVRLASARSRSPGETRLRVFWLVDCGLPPPEVNALVHREDGELLGMVDLLEPVTGTVGEYDGAHHLGVHQRAVDAARDQWLRQVGLHVVRVTQVDLAQHRARTRERLVAARSTGRARRGRPRPWYWTEGPMPAPAPRW